MPYDPTKAGDPVPRKFKNVLKCIANEIITMAEAVTRGRYRALPDGVGENEPYWDLCFETLDARREDGSPLSIPTCGKLYTKEGKRQDNTQRPYRVSMAFAGLGISIFPGDPQGHHNAFCLGIGEDPIGDNPSYDASKVVGRVFVCEMEKMEYGRDMPLPLTAEPEGYLYTGKVREVRPREGSDTQEDGTAQPTANNNVDITKPEGAEARKQMLDILDGTSVDEELFDLLKAKGMDNQAQFEGQSAIGAALDGPGFIVKLTEHGYITVTDGRIAVST